MSEISERYKTWAVQLTQKIESVPDGAWENPSPCTDWSTRDVVDHLVSTSKHFLSYIQKEIPNLPSVENNPTGAWHAARDVVQSALEDEELANKECNTPMGVETFAKLVDSYLCFDLVVHAWDVAHAAGIDETLDISAIRELRPRAEAIVELGRQMGAFGPAIDVSEDADEQTQLLAILGRDSRD